MNNESERYIILRGPYLLKAFFVNAQTYLNIGMLFPTRIWLPVISIRRQQHRAATEIGASKGLIAATVIETAIPASGTDKT